MLVPEAAVGAGPGEVGIGAGDDEADAGGAEISGDPGALASALQKIDAYARGGRVNLQKAAEIAINDFRSGAWGGITLETPEEFALWWAEGQVRDAAGERMPAAAMTASRTDAISSVADAFP